MDDHRAQAYRIRLTDRLVYFSLNHPSFLMIYERLLSRQANKESPMKSMTCNQLGGACDLVFSGDSFDDLAAQSQQHGKEMFGANDGPHMAAMGAMMEIMNSGEMDSWMAARQAEFDAL